MAQSLWSVPGRFLDQMLWFTSSGELPIVLKHYRFPKKVIYTLMWYQESVPGFFGNKILAPALLSPLFSVRL